MKTENKGKLAIEVTDDKNRVIFHPVNGSVWMNRNELCQLFGCYMKDIDRCIGEIFEKDMLQVEENCKYHIVAGGSRISYDITEVNLKVVVTMVFRLGTPEARLLREWFIERLSKIKCLEVVFSDIGERVLLN